MQEVTVFYKITCTKQWGFKPGVLQMIKGPKPKSKGWKWTTTIGWWRWIIKKTIVLKEEPNGCPKVQINEFVPHIVDKNEDKNTSIVVVANEALSKGMNRLHDSDNYDSNKELVNHLKYRPSNFWIFIGHCGTSSKGVTWG